VVFNTYLVFSINTMSVSDSRESCASSHCPRVVRTRGARCRRVVRALLSCCRASFARAVRTRRHTLFSCVACATYSCRSPCRTSFARISRIGGMGRTTFARDNKLLSLTNTHINNVNLSGHIF
jgi:hypothetical protein